tara:strand:- start:338 stop:1018 length:681 start_codon:yes stop_codon:yes gene_type:complete
MMGRIPETQFDLRFRVGPIPVRVHPVFWVTAAFVVWGAYNHDPPQLLLAVLAVFLSVLVHELGHATMTRIFGWPSEIVLGFFGGYATTSRTSTGRNLAVLFAGPGAGLALAALSFATIVVLARSEQAVLPRVNETLGFLLVVNIFWSVLNLVPVLPLDGGQIAREILVWQNPYRGQQRAMLVSAVAGAGAAAVGYVYGQTFLAILFGLFAYQNFSGWQMTRRGGWQ